MRAWYRLHAACRAQPAAPIVQVDALWDGLCHWMPDTVHHNRLHGPVAARRAEPGPGPGQCLDGDHLAGASLGAPICSGFCMAKWGFASTAAMDAATFWVSSLCIRSLHLEHIHRGACGFGSSQPCRFVAGRSNGLADALSMQTGVGDHGRCVRVECSLRPTRNIIANLCAQTIVRRRFAPLVPRPSRRISLPGICGRCVCRLRTVGAHRRPTARARFDARAGDGVSGFDHRRRTL